MYGTLYRDGDKFFIKIDIIKDALTYLKEDFDNKNITRSLYLIPDNTEQ